MDISVLILFITLAVYRDTYEENWDFCFWEVAIKQSISQFQRISKVPSRMGWSWSKYALSICLCEWTARVKGYQHLGEGLDSRSNRFIRKIEVCRTLAFYETRYFIFDGAIPLSAVLVG